MMLQDYSSFGGDIKAAYHVYSRAFARPTGPHNADKITFFDYQVYSPEGVDLHFSHPVDFPDIFEFYYCVAHCSCPFYKPYSFLSSFMVLVSMLPISFFRFFIRPDIYNPQISFLSASTSGTMPLKYL